MDVSEFSPINWVFLASLATIAIGLVGWYINRSIVELKARLKPKEGVAEHSLLEETLLPERRATGGRMANQEFHQHVDEKARNGISRFFLMIAAFGLVVHAGAWIYMINFSDK